MAGFTTWDSVINAMSTNLDMQRIPFTKLLPSTTASVPHTFWKSTGIPGAGTDPSAGLAGAVKCSSATTGSLIYTNATSPATMSIVGLDINCNQTGTFILCDRLAHANVAINQANGSFSPIIDGTDRLGATEGGMILVEVTGALSAAANVFNLTYTNQAGASKTTANVTTVASSIVGRVPYASYLWVPLAAGDTGVRTITGWTLVSGTATGNINIVLVRPLVYAPIVTANVSMTINMVNDVVSLPVIKDNSSLYFVYLGASASTPYISGELRILEN